MALNRSQISIIKGMVGAAIFSVLFILGGLAWSPFALPPLPMTLGDRLAFTLQWEFLAILLLFAGVMVAAQQRFFSTKDIAGDATATSHSLAINLRYIQNTLEQCVLLIFGHLALATVLPDEALQIIPILVLLFVIGRVAFWAGYHRSPTSRAFGFATTFYPTIGVLLFATYKIFLG